MSLCRFARPLYALAAVRSERKSDGWWLRRRERQRRADRGGVRPGIVIVQNAFLIKSLTLPVRVENENGRHLAPAAFGLRKSEPGEHVIPRPGRKQSPFAACRANLDHNRHSCKSAFAEWQGPLKPRSGRRPSLPAAGTRSLRPSPVTRGSVTGILRSRRYAGRGEAGQGARRRWASASKPRAG